MNDAVLILATRNDGFGAGDPLKRLRCTIESIRRLPGSPRLVVMDWAGARPLPEDIVAAVESIPSARPSRVVSVPPLVEELLAADAVPEIRLPFHEFIAKEAAVEITEEPILCFTNPDNIHPARGWLQAVAQAEQGRFVRGHRHDVPRCEHRDVNDLVSSAERAELPVCGIYDTAGGDFLMVRRDRHLEWGRHLLVHGNWDVDNEYLRRAQSLGATAVWAYQHYHLDHPSSSGPSFGRPKGDAAGYRRVSPEVWEQCVQMTR